MDSKIKVRMDQWLSAVRVFKTRSQAADACKKGKVLIDGNSVKPSQPVKIGETIQVKMTGILRTFLVKGLLAKRVSAKIAVDYVEETTPPEEFERLREIRNNPFALRDRGAGRPTKRERGDLDRLKDIFDDSL